MEQEQVHDKQGQGRGRFMIYWGCRGVSWGGFMIHWGSRGVGGGGVWGGGQGAVLGVSLLSDLSVDGTRDGEVFK